MKVTVNRTPRAVDALDAVTSRTRDSKTDAVNRALTVYQIVLDLADRSGGAPVFLDANGQRERVHLL